MIQLKSPTPSNQPTNLPPPKKIHSEIQDLQGLGKKLAASSSCSSLECPELRVDMQTLSGELFGDTQGGILFKVSIAVN